jgi:phosphate transport system permease protein
MPFIWLLVLLAALAAIGFVLGRSRALASGKGNIRNLHSLPSYYGYNAALLSAVPALLLMAAWLLIQPVIIENRIINLIPETAISEDSTRALVMSDVRRIAEGLNTAVAEAALTDAATRSLDATTTDIRQLLGQVGVALGSEVQPAVLNAAQSYRAFSASLAIWMTVLVIGAAITGLAYAVTRTNAAYRARNMVEAMILALLTTVGIIFSMVFETRNFFLQYPWHDFFFGLTWSPSFSGRGGASQLGIIPLLWGTLYVSFIALLVAVPVGLFAAIYLSEYAGPKMRVIAKPLIEILAGIPTIVYGLFALITVGPLLRDYFAAPLGIGDSSSSVMTAGIVMGVMLIPFVSSLSDDIINAVPQNMRDGSFALGATHSETIRQVVIPAALPGIVGAVLLATSRAIGETMIVVLGAGAAAKLDLNPFEAMTTVTVKIVSQLTGDTDFASAETLVAFALGLTLFTITLGLNVLALFIVRKYREQYE